jgi:hypothetical protein
MKHISNYYLRGLGQRQSVTFFEKACQSMDIVDDKKFLPIKQTFRESIERYKKSLEPTAQDILSNQISVEEENCISIWMNMRKTADSLISVRSGFAHDIGSKMDALLNQAGGDPTGQNAPRKTALYRRLLKSIHEELPEEDLIRANLDPWVEALEKATKHVEEMETDKFFGLSNLYITRTNAGSRKEAELAYLQAAHFINAMYTYLNDQVCEEVIDYINLLIENAKSGSLDTTYAPEAAHKKPPRSKKPKDNSPGIFT